MFLSQSKKSAFTLILFRVREKYFSRSKGCNRRYAFTLIELLVVIVIIGILATISVAQLSNYGARARDAKRKHDIATINQAIELYSADGRGFYEKESAIYDASVGVFSDEEPYLKDDADIESDWGVASDLRDLMPEYLSVLPVDPMNTHQYYYRYEPRQVTGTVDWSQVSVGYFLCARLESKNVIWCKDSYGTGERTTGNIPGGSAWLTY